MYVISVEQLLSKVVETYLSEKHDLEKQLSSSLDVPVTAGDVDSPLTPTITVHPSSTVAVEPSTTVAVEPSTDGHPHREEQKEEEGAALVKEEEEKMEAQEQKEGILPESLMAKVVLYTPY